MGSYIDGIKQGGDHATMSDLDYVSSGHTGFEPSTNPTIIAVSDAPATGGIFNGGFETNPPFVTIQSGSGWIDGTSLGSPTNAASGWWFQQAATYGYAYFDNVITHNSKSSMKIFGGTVTAVQSMYVTLSLYNVNPWNAVPLKANTTYKFSGWMKTRSITNANGGGAFFRIITLPTYSSGSTLAYHTTGTTDWTYYSAEFTNGVETLADIQCILEFETGTAWFDDLKIEEIVSDTANTSLVPTPLLATVTGITSTDNLVYTQATQDTGAAIGNVNAVRAVANSFTASGTHLSKITLYKKNCVGAPTGTLTVSIRPDNAGAPSSSILASLVYTAATWNALGGGVDGVAVDFILPCILTVGTTYWVDVRDSVPELVNVYYYIKYKAAVAGAGTMKTYNNVTWSTVVGSGLYLNIYYARNTQNATIVCNGEKISLDADGDGMLGGSIIDLDKGEYSYDTGLMTTLDLAQAFANNIFYTSADLSDGFWSPTSPCVIRGAPFIAAPWYLLLSNTAGAKAAIKVNTVVPMKNMVVTITSCAVASVGLTISYALDIPGWGVGTVVPLESTPTSPAGMAVISLTIPNIPAGTKIVYLWFEVTTGLVNGAIERLQIKSDLDTSLLPSLILQPIGVPVQYSENVILPVSADRIYLRMAKYANNRGVVIPHLEFCATDVPISAIPLKVDNSGETNPAVEIIAAETNTCTVGTGTAEGLNFILNDGEYVTITTPSTSIKVTYLVGKGTTSFSNLTMNSIYLSSNGVANFSSHKFNFYLGMMKEGVSKIVERLDRSVNDLATNNNYFLVDSTRPLTGSFFSKFDNSFILAFNGGTGYHNGTGASFAVCGSGYLNGAIYFSVPNAAKTANIWVSHFAPGDTPYLSMDSHNISDLLDPLLAYDAATKNYVDGKWITGMIMIWSGSVASIPTGWVLCNGSSSTPDLRNRFVIGAGDTYAVAATGGSATHTNTIDEMAAHTHQYYQLTTTHTGATGTAKDVVVGGGYQNTLTNGNGTAYSILNPYYALAYIMKT